MSPIAVEVSSDSPESLRPAWTESRGRPVPRFVRVRARVRVLASINLVQKLLGHTGTSWRWLSVFALLHGLHEWCEALLRALPETTPLAPINRLLTLAA